MRIRTVEPEILDSLAHDDPRALRNRRDLRLINSIMGNPSWFARKVFPLVTEADQVMELGAGEGRLGKLFFRLQGGSTIPYTAVDLAPAPDDWPDHYSWRQVDGMTLPEFSPCTALLGNMILHQFQDEALRKLGEKIRHSTLRLLAFVEPTRHPLHLWQFRTLFPVMNAVSRHDGCVSIRAGFRANELAEILGLDDWQVRVSTTCFGGYRLLAQRITKAP